MTLRPLLTLLLGALLLPAAAQKFDGLALTPPMGWNSWNTFACDIDETTVKETADLFVKLGLKEAGYQYIVVDDGWMEMRRDPETLRLVPCHKKFPHGMKPVVDYVHGQGLRFGIYNCAGVLTCGGYPGTRGYEFLDAKQYAEWGVDFLKYDWCSTGSGNGGLPYQQEARASYTLMRDALRQAGRPVLFNICEWGDNQPWLWAKDVGHSWRISGDIACCWDCELSYGGWSSFGIWPIIRMRQGIRQYSGPGHWNDFDMMEVGNGLSPAEDRTHFAMWCMLASPLFLGNDIRKMSQETLKLVTNKELIAIDQDPLGIQAFRFINDAGYELWVKPLDKGQWALAFVNMGEGTLDIDYDWRRFNIKDGTFGRSVDFHKEAFDVRDCVNHNDADDTGKNFKHTLQKHDIVVLRLTPKR